MLGSGGASDTPNDTSAAPAAASAPPESEEEACCKCYPRSSAIIRYRCCFDEPYRPGKRTALPPRTIYRCSLLIVALWVVGAYAALITLATWMRTERITFQGFANELCVDVSLHIKRTLETALERVDGISRLAYALGGPEVNDFVHFNAEVFETFVRNPPGEPGLLNGVGYFARVKNTSVATWRNWSHCPDEMYTVPYHLPAGDYTYVNFSGAAEPLPPKAEYYPALYAYPAAELEGCGFVLDSHKIYDTVIHNAIDRGVVTSVVFRLTEFVSPQTTLVGFYRAFYRNNSFDDWMNNPAITLQQRRDAAIGVIGGFSSMQRLIDEAINQLNTDAVRMELQLVDLSIPDRAQGLLGYYLPSGGGDESTLETTFQSSVRVDLPGQDWRLYCTPTSRLFDLNIDDVAYLLAGAVLVIDTLLCVVVYRYTADLRAISRLLRAVKAQYDDAQRAHRMKADFLSFLCHEVRNSLHGIMSMASFVLSPPYQLGTSEREHIVTIMESSELMRTVVNDALDLNEMTDKGKFQFQALAFHFPDLCQSIMRVYRPHADAKGLGFSIEFLESGTASTGIGADLAIAEWIRSDPIRLRQIFGALISNAIKFTTRGRVKITIRFLEPATAAALLRPGTSAARTAANQALALEPGIATLSSGGMSSLGMPTLLHRGSLPQLGGRAHAGTPKDRRRTLAVGRIAPAAAQPTAAPASTGAVGDGGVAMTAIQPNPPPSGVEAMASLAAAGPLFTRVVAPRGTVPGISSPSRPGIGLAISSPPITGLNGPTVISAGASPPTRSGFEVESKDRTGAGKERAAAAATTRFVPQMRRVIEVRVSDTGIGIRPEVLPTLWESYSHTRLSMAHEYGGTGLGIPIVKRVMDGLGGAVSVETKLGVGSTFTLMMPVDVLSTDDSKACHNAAVEAATELMNQRRAAGTASSAAAAAAAAAGTAGGGGGGDANGVDTKAGGAGGGGGIKRDEDAQFVAANQPRFRIVTLQPTTHTVNMEPDAAGADTNAGAGGHKISVLLPVNLTPLMPTGADATNQYGDVPPLNSSVAVSNRLSANARMFVSSLNAVNGAGTSSSSSNSHNSHASISPQSNTARAHAPPPVTIPERSAAAAVGLTVNTNTTPSSQAAAPPAVAPAVRTPSPVGSTPTGAASPPAGAGTNPNADTVTSLPGQSTPTAAARRFPPARPPHQPMLTIPSASGGSPKFGVPATPAAPDVAFGAAPVPAPIEPEAATVVTDAAATAILPEAEAAAVTTTPLHRIPPLLTALPTTFTPAVAAPAVAVAPTVSSVAASLVDAPPIQLPRVLLAEDSKINQMVLLRMLHNRHCVLDVVENGAEAVKRLTADRKRYALVLMDINMPVMCGDKATIALRTVHGFTPAALPIVAVTANAMPTDVATYRSIGMNDVITKPFSVERIVGVIQLYTALSAATAKTADGMKQWEALIPELAAMRPAAAATSVPSATAATAAAPAAAP